MTEDVHLVEFEFLADRRKLLYESFGLPQCFVRRPIRLAAAELIIEHDRPVVRESAQPSQVVAWESRTAVKEQQWCGVAGADNSIPYLSARNVDESLTGSDAWLFHLGAAGYQDDCRDYKRDPLHL